MSVSMSGSGVVGLGVGCGGVEWGYQPGVYVSLKALFLFFFANMRCFNWQFL